MGPKDQELLKKLLATFKVEAAEHINAISAGLLELEQADSQESRLEIIEHVFREAHSLKGAARAVNLVRIESTCQSLEGLFASLKAQEAILSSELFDQLYRMVDALGILLSTASIESSHGRQQTPAVREESWTTIVPASQHESGGTVGARGRQALEDPNEPQRPSEERPGISQTLRITTSKLDSLLRQVEELVPAKITTAQRVEELRKIGNELGLRQREWTKLAPQRRVVRDYLDKGTRSNGHARPVNGPLNSKSEITRVLAWIDQTESAMHSVKNKLAILTKHLENDCRALERRIDDLVEGVKRVSTMPFSVLLESFPKLVRDLCRDCGKDAELVIEGADIEADRRILEEMKDPLIHLVRNCIDHGIEPPKQREERGKPARATISIAISPRSADKVEITVSDDGAGIDIAKVRATAARRTPVQEQDAPAMDEQQAIALIFGSGFSTSPMITEVSGRGLGLAIVRGKAERVGGTVSTETRTGAGTTFRLILPRTLARFRGVLARVGENEFVVPTMHVRRVLRVGRDEIKSAENRDTIQVDGRAASSVWLRDVLELAPRNPIAGPQRKVAVLVLAWAGEQIAFCVDEILDEQEVLVKSLGKQLSRVRNVAGATVLGTGRVVPVLDVADLMMSAVRMSPPASHETKEAMKSLLVVEDSITARTLLKNILESAGYKVKTAIDGLEAFAMLARESFDLVVSDVEMPRMSGFDLTAKIRADKRLARLPVVLVTALDSREDRERGIDVGANAYIVKSSFDQGNLLEVVRRLI